MRLKKIAAPVLALTLILGISVPALAADKHPFTDVPAWADAAVTYSYDNGYINGASATAYNSDGQITIVEFVKVMVQMCTTQEQRTAIMDKAGTATEQAADWTYQYRTIGKEIGLYGYLEQYEGDKGETKCTRAVMAHILVNTLKARGEDISSVDATAYIEKFTDTTAIKNSPYVNDIGTAISLGLIGGDNNRNFLPDDFMNRASAAQVFIRLDNPNGERAAVLKSVQNAAETTPPSGDHGPLPPANPNGNPSGPSATTPITIDMRNPGSHRPPQEGDTVIRPDGTKVVLTRTYGVIGYGQNVGAWLGTVGANGSTVQQGTFTSSTTAGWDDGLAGGFYLKSNIPGQENTYHWASEWAAILENTKPTTEGKDGQVDSTGLWKYSVSAAMGGRWGWQGPNEASN